MLYSHGVLVSYLSCTCINTRNMYYPFSVSEAGYEAGATATGKQTSISPSLFSLSPSSRSRQSTRTTEVARGCACPYLEFQLVVARSCQNTVHVWPHGQSVVYIYLFIFIYFVLSPSDRRQKLPQTAIARRTEKQRKRKKKKNDSRPTTFWFAHGLQHRRDIACRQQQDALPTQGADERGLSVQPLRRCVDFARFVPFCCHLFPSPSLFCLWSF